MNNVNLIGRLVRDPEMRFTEGGLAVTRMTIAVDKGLSKEKRAEFESKNKPTADFIRLVGFGGLAETCANHLAKGRLIGVSGRIETGSYDHEDGTKRYTTDVIVSNLDILEWPDKNEKTDSGIEGFHPTDSDDIPF